MQHFDSMIEMYTQLFVSQFTQLQIEGLFFCNCYFKYFQVSNDNKQSWYIFWTTHNRWYLNKSTDSKSCRMPSWAKQLLLSGHNCPASTEECGHPARLENSASYVFHGPRHLQSPVWSYAQIWLTKYWYISSKSVWRNKIKRLSWTRHPKIINRLTDAHNCQYHIITQLHKNRLSKSLIWIQA